MSEDNNTHPIFKVTQQRLKMENCVAGRQNWELQKNVNLLNTKHRAEKLLLINKNLELTRQYYYQKSNLNKMLSKSLENCNVEISKIKLKRIDLKDSQLEKKVISVKTLPPPRIQRPYFTFNIALKISKSKKYNIPISTGNLKRHSKGNQSVQKRAKRKVEKIKYKCGKCLYSCSKEGDFSEHKRIHEKALNCIQLMDVLKQTTVFKCYQCEFSCTQLTVVREHMKDHSVKINASNDAKLFVHRCDMCMFASWKKVDFLKHRHTHEESLMCLQQQINNKKGHKFKCYQCEYSCESLSDVRKHMRNHNIEKDTAEN